MEKDTFGSGKIQRWSPRGRPWPQGHILKSLALASKLKSLALASNQIKSNLSLYSLHYAEACNELAGPISASLRPGNTAPFEEMSQRWRAVGNTVSDLTGPRFEPHTSRSRDKRVTARPTGRLALASKPTSPRKCPVLDSRTTTFFERLKKIRGGAKRGIVENCCSYFC